MCIESYKWTNQKINDKKKFTHMKNKSMKYYY